MNKDKIIYYLLLLYFLVSSLCPSGIKVKGITLEDCILGITLLIYLTITLITKKHRESFKIHLMDFLHNNIGILMSIIAVIMLISVSYSLEKKLAITETIRFITFAGMFFMVKYNISGRKEITNILRLFMVFSFLLSFYGIFQYFTGFGLDKGFVEQYSFGARARIAAIFGNPNSYAGYLIILIFPIIMLCLETKKKAARIVYFVLAILLFINLILTFSRNSWAAFGIGLLLLVVYYNWKLIIAFVLIGISSLFIPVVGNRLKDFVDINQNVSRFHHWQTALYMFKDHPLFGVGNGNYVSYYDSYIEKYPYLDFAHQRRFPSHNSYLKVTSELGTIGIIPFIMLLVTSISRLKKSIKFIDDVDTRAFMSGFFISSIVFMFMNFFDNLFFVPKVTVLFWLFLAIAEGFIYRGTNNLN